MSNWSTGNRSDFGIEVSDVENETGYFEANVTFWVHDVPTATSESLAALLTYLADILSTAHRPALELPRDWSAAQVAEHLVELLHRERTDAEDEQLFAHLALPFLDSTRDRVVFLARSDSRELLVLVDEATSKVLASSELRPGQYALVVRSFIDWIDGILPSTGRARASYVIQE